ncbi:hypothetical protein HanRHA438_Chr06g0271721 [Helianthus annuus]|nr:hypothetical protein HanRHA438_Chr06g0271721 [Helianthus annuus]
MIGQKRKDANKAELNSLMKLIVLGPILHTTEFVKYVEYKWVFYANHVKIKLNEIRKNWWHKDFAKTHDWL